MPTKATLRALGGSTVVVIPPAFLCQLGLAAKSTVDVEIRDGQLIIAPAKRPHYTLEGLMAQCDLTQPETAAEREWLDAPAVGNEAI